ncbi:MULTISPECIES: hypothetical protein [unclassified Bradyrhizobium]|uniref:hypothetical protein n=1 Tax=unclassified Bradyrhizobium TaxID=2631580 RepID=UPI002FF27AD9
MTALANLLARKQQLLDRMQGDMGPNEREETERLLKQIDTAWELLGTAGSGKSSEE